MTSIALRRISCVTLAVVLGAGCGTSANMGGGIAGTGAVIAPISGFGSVIVGGIEFDTTNAEITIEGDPALVSDLRLGMVASVRGFIDTRHARGIAQRIAVEHVAEGPIDTVDIANSTLTLLGQLILTDADTVFDPVPLQQLVANEYVEIAGFLDTNGRIRATRVAEQFQKREIAVQGFVEELDPVAQTFAIGSLTVDFSSAVITGAPEGLQNGLRVEVASDNPPAAGEVSATDVEVKTAFADVDEGDGFKVEGFVTEITSPTDLVVNRIQPVHLTPMTRFVHGNSSDLVLGARVDIDGVAGADGLLIATKIDFSS